MTRPAILSPALVIVARLGAALLCGILAGPSLRAGPTDSAIIAAMKLPEAKSYSWTTAVDDDARSYEISGRTDQSDFSLVTMPMVSAVRRRVSRSSSNSDNQVDAVFLGAERCVIQTDDGWKTPAELAALRQVDRRGLGGPAGPLGSPGLPGGIPPPIRRGPGAGQSPPAYSNLQLNLSRPAEEIGVIVGSHTEIKADGDVFTGTLSETGAKLLLVHPGQNELTPIQARGTFRLWIRDGALVKYELILDGTLAVETPNARREVVVHQKSTTTLKDVGTTTFTVPPEAREKLGG
jgi:hypothetical protein